jgi:hypothetical protein
MFDSKYDVDYLPASSDRSIRPLDLVFGAILGAILILQMLIFQGQKPADRPSEHPAAPASTTLPQSVAPAQIVAPTPVVNRAHLRKAHQKLHHPVAVSRKVSKSRLRSRPVRVKSNHPTVHAPADETLQDEFVQETGSGNSEDSVSPEDSRLTDGEI